MSVLVPEFEIVEGHLRELVVVYVRGELDGSNCAQLRTHLTSLIDAGVVDLAVDLAGISFIDSAGLGVLIGALKRLQNEGGRLSISSPSRGVCKVLEITGMSSLVEIG